MYLNVKRQAINDISLTHKLLLTVDESFEKIIKSHYYVQRNETLIFLRTATYLL